MLGCRILAGVTRVYDLVMTHKLDADDFFIQRVQQHCAERGLNFFLIEPLWVEAFHDYLASGKIRARAVLNMHSEHHQPGDIFHRLVWLAHERRAQVIDPPDVALAAFDKARLHSRLIAAGLNTPFTVVVARQEVEVLALAATDREALGTPFVIKPAMGYGRRGVILDATNEGDLRRSVAAWPEGSYLLQRRVSARSLNGQPAYFRVFFVFGSVWCCWWNCFTDNYRLMTTAEEQQFGLTPLREIIGRIATLTGMKFFSSEIALTDAGEFVLIDYVNDQCHMLSQSASPQTGVPDELVAAVAYRLVEGVHGLIGPSR
ncbi:MAG TPA: hypothetical protein VJW76_08215 [Verrucomicrobiae bacterium]|nr:hypothetical protein [Verrucomicrobiae bacterium]